MKDVDGDIGIDTMVVEECLEHLERIGLLSGLSSNWLLATLSLILIYIAGGFVLNTACFVAILRTNKSLNSDNLLVMTLCLANLLFCVLVLPFEAIRFFYGSWIFGEGFVCAVSTFCRYLIKGLSLFIILLMSVNRLIVVMSTRPRRDGISCAKLVVILLLFVFILSAFLLLQVTHVYGRIGYHQYGQTCTIMSYNGYSPKKLLIVVGTLLPMASIVISYSTIVFKIALSRRSVKRYSRGARGSSKQSVVLRLGVAVFVVFLATNLPSLITKVADPHYHSHVWHLISYWCFYSGGLANPLVFVLFNRGYRQAVRKLALDIVGRGRLLSLNQLDSATCNQLLTVANMTLTI